MPLTIGAVTLFGTEVMGLSLGAAIVLGAMLAPTDPVLAGDIGVGPPGDEDEHEPNFSITGEAGLNDGLALPFLFLGLFVADEGGSGWLGEWVLADVLYAIGVAVAIGAAIGYGTGALAVRLRDRDLLAKAFDPWLAIPTVLLIYGAHRGRGGLRLRRGLRRRRRLPAIRARPRAQQAHPRRRRVGGEVRRARRGAVWSAACSPSTGWRSPDSSGWLLVPVLLLAIRPLAVAISMLRSGTPAPERAFVGWFGVRGVGSLYYLAIAVGAGVLAPDEIETIVWTVIACVGVSLSSTA